MSTNTRDNPLLPGIKALTFDVFGTLVSWRPIITQALQTTLPPLSSSSSRPSASELATLWHSAYAHFTLSFDPSRQPWKDIDTHHHDSLISLLQAHDVFPLPPASDLQTLSRTWHFLPPHPDVPRALRALSRRYKTATLSNGNTSLLEDLVKFGSLEFTHIISAEDFKAYKPNPKVYLGACEKLGDLEPNEVAMVASHLGDLQAAKDLGFNTIYIERAGEETWGPNEERYDTARKWVDVWVREDEGGLEEVVRRLGLEEDMV